MQYINLGKTGLKVSRICLGCMSYGDPSDVNRTWVLRDEESRPFFKQALDAGINFFDTANVYSNGVSEEITGRALKDFAKRDEIVLATKVHGQMRGDPNGKGLSRKAILTEIDHSLKRLQTDYVDLYQVHWPDRTANRFGQVGYRHVDAEQPVPIEETLAALTELVREGKARYVGVSNETPWGVAQYLKAADGGALERIASIQNPYNLLNRGFETGLAEFAIRERIGLLAYSPLAFGMLTGKYLDGARPPEARVVRWPRYGRYNGEAAQRATAEYVALARRHGLDPAQMAIAFAKSQRFVASVLLGAATLAQLEVDLAADALRLDPEIIEELEQVQRRHPNPAA